MKRRAMRKKEKGRGYITQDIDEISTRKSRWTKEQNCLAVNLKW